MRYTRLFTYCLLPLLFSPVPYSRLDAARSWGKPPRPRCIAVPCSLKPKTLSLTQLVNIINLCKFLCQQVLIN
ncbi:MAG: hypothetical protein F6J90_22595 [Moorea sp. SIOASIH]|uniref:hypothetical protein n=1 Tax=Moorena sp. SIOASIH TaxID=2607817 RepID=UPI0013B72A70|nr:hypothetical protein [Moorena sp. SIOASIH]NEO38971.1 hypothetical protein [Moorena sp. SIOASIH]